MALLKLGGIITKISGKIGGNILGTSPNGSYIKSNSYSQQHTSPAQSLQRTKVYLVPQLWRTLTGAQQLLWSNEVVNYPYVNRVGDNVFYTGFQLFCKLNMNLLNIGGSVVLNPPTFVSVPNATVPDVLAESTQLEVEYYNQTSATYIQFWLAKSTQNSVVPDISKFKYADLVTSATSSDTIELYPKYLELFGVIPNLQYITVAIRNVSNVTGLPPDFIYSVPYQYEL